MMKKVMSCVFVLILALACASAPASAGDDAQIAEALRQAGVSRPVQLSQWGDTAACFAETDGTKRLILLENRDGAWQVAIDNPAALLQDFDWPHLWLDSDNSVFWTYSLSDLEIVRYHSLRNADGVWGPVDQFYYDNGYGEYSHILYTCWDDSHGGEILRSFSVADEDDNLIGGESVEYLPASWMKDCIRLADFDVSRFPTMFIATNDYFAYENERFFREAAAALLPEYTFIKGMLKNGALHFLTEKPDGTRVYVICEYASRRAVNLIESTPLPEGTVLGWENFTDSLRIGDLCVTVRLLDRGTAGIEYVYNDAADAEQILFFGDRTVWQDVWLETVLYGDHPWDDITRIDWNTLPRTRYQASLQLDAGAYAQVVNPGPADRLHLRERPDRKSPSLGKYYSGTPVTVLGEQGDWAEVTVGGRHGWMMKDFLDLGRLRDDALRLNTLPMPQLSSGKPFRLFDEPQDGAYTWHMVAGEDTMKVIGILGDEWYHVWFPASGEYGFVRQGDLMPGNG